MFFGNGALCAALLPRYPEIKDAYGLSDGHFGLMVISFATGAMVATGFAGQVIRRLGNLRTVGVSAVALAAALTAAGASDSVWLLVGALMFAGAFDGVMDAAMNVQGVLVERWRGRSWINGFHAVWSLGAAAGGAIGAAGAALDIGIGVQMLGNSIVWTLVVLAGCRLARVPRQVFFSLASGPAAPTEESLTPEASNAPSAAPRATAWFLLGPLVALAVSGTLVEDLANNWAILYLRRVALAPADWAGLGLTVTLLAQFGGRLLGDRMTDRFGRDQVARIGGFLIAVGGLCVVAGPGYPYAFAGFALMGFGSATLVPAAFAAAGRLPGLPHGTGIAMLSWLMRLGFLLTSPIIGLVSQTTTLRTAMLLPLIAGVGAALLAATLRPEPARHECA